MMRPLEKQDVQVIDNQQNTPVLFVKALLHLGGGWGANKSPSPPPLPLDVPLSRFTLAGPACWV